MTYHGGRLARAARPFSYSVKVKIEGLNKGGISTGGAWLGRRRIWTDSRQVGMRFTDY